MMRNFLKIIAAVLAVVFAASCLAACGGGQGGETTTAAGTAVAEATTPDPNVETVFDPKAIIPETDLEKYTFKILSPVHDWAIVEMLCDEINGDVMKDAICERQINVEERLNCKMQETVLGTNYAERIRVVAQGGPEDAYDIAQMTTYDAYALFLEGYLADQAKIESMNLSNPWWEKKFNDEVNLGGKRYISFGNESLIFYSSFYIFCFNKDMITNYALDNPYDLVESREWTWDKAYQMMKVVADDGQDGSCDPGTDDILGLTGHVNHSRNIIFSSGLSICQRDDDGMLTYDGLSRNYVDAFEKYTRYFITDSADAIAGVNPNKYAGYTSQAGLKNYVSVFVEGKSLFITTGTNEVITFREGSTEYGIVVVPMYSADQEDYVTPVYSAAEGMVVPVSSQDTERAGLLLEAFGAYSYNNIIDKHIKIVLHYRATSDPTAIKMINVAYENGRIDVAMAHNFGQCTTLLNNLNVNGVSEITRVFDQAKALMQKQLREAREKLAQK